MLFFFYFFLFREFKLTKILHGSFVQGKRFVFVTNNSRKSRKQYAKKFSKLGMEINEVCCVHYFLTFFFYLCNKQLVS